MTKKIISCKIKNNDYLPIALEIIYLYLFISRKISKYGYMKNKPQNLAKYCLQKPINRKIDCFGRHCAILKNKTLNQKIHWKASKILFGHLGWVRVLKLDPTKNWFVSGSSDRTLKFWEYPGGVLKKTLTGHIEQITDCDINQEFRNMLSCGLDKLIKCWDIDNFKSTCSYYGHKSGVYVLKILQRFNIFASGGRDCVCRVWDIRSNYQYYSLSGHKNTITSMIRGSEQMFLVTGSLDRTVKSWDINSGICFQTLNISNCPIRQLQNGIDSKSFFILQRNNLFKLRMTKETQTLKRLTTLKKISLISISVDKCGSLFIGTNKSVIFIFNKISSNFVKKLMLPINKKIKEDSILSIIVDGSGNGLLTATTSRLIIIWNKY